MSDKRLDSIAASNYKITPELSFYGTKTRVEFNGSCLKQDKVTYNYEKIVNTYIIYEISKNYNISRTKNVDIYKYKYSGYGIGFDRYGEFSFGNGLGKNCIIFGADLSNSSLHDNDKKMIFLFLVKILYNK